MTCSSVSESLKNFALRTLKSSPLVVLLLVAMFASAKPAQAQNSDTWKSVAIIGGSTAAGAYIGHKVAGSTGAYVGAAAGASAGYAVDRWRRQNEYNNGYYGDNGNYNGNSGGYYGNNYPSNDNGGYYGGAPYPANYRSSDFSARRR